MTVIRSAREEEVMALAAIGVAAWEGAIEGVADAQAMRRVAELAFLSFLRSKWFLVRVIDHEGAAAGWVAREDSDGQISDLWVRPGHQRCGLGSRLLTEMESRILAEGFEAVEIKTHAKNAPAIGFFLKHGYSITWLSTAYATKLDRDVESVGLRKYVEPIVFKENSRWL